MSRTVSTAMRTLLRELKDKYQPLSEGKVADYIPELAKADPEWFATNAPFANASEAGELCSSLKAAGGQCLIQKN